MKVSPTRGNPHEVLWHSSNKLSLFLQLCKVPFLIRSHHSRLPCIRLMCSTKQQAAQATIVSRIFWLKSYTVPSEVGGDQTRLEWLWTFWLCQAATNSDLQLKLYFPHPQICKGPLGSAWSKLHYRRSYTSALCICLHTSNYCDCSLVHATTTLQQFTQYVFSYVECILPATQQYVCGVCSLWMHASVRREQSRPGCCKQAAHSAWHV